MTRREGDLDGAPGRVRRPRAGFALSVHVAPRLTIDDGDPTSARSESSATFVDWPARSPGWSSRSRSPISSTDRPTATVPTATKAEPMRTCGRALPERHARPAARIPGPREAKHPRLPGARRARPSSRPPTGRSPRPGPGLPAVDDPKGPLAVFGALDGLADGCATRRATTTSSAGRGRRPKARRSRTGSSRTTTSAAPACRWQQQAAQAALGEAARFYYRPGSRTPTFPEDYIEPPPDVPRSTSTRSSSLLADHPTLLRRLGLVIDLVVDAARARRGSPGSGRHSGRGPRQHPGGPADRALDALRARRRVVRRSAAG